ncbi:MAG: STAS domain-containing protein [Clostridiales Family XIII bacterium]|nr:STAS domain-containing protein [Clostridiales Family XIII bacterium]
MTINTVENGNKLLLELEGRLDTITSKDLEKQLPALDDKDNVVFDFDKLDYISSAGLRVVLQAQKKMNAIGGELIIKNASDGIIEVFDMTGFSDILTIE